MARCSSSGVTRAKARCPACRQERDARRGPPSRRGYGRAHRAEGDEAIAREPWCHGTPAGPCPYPDTGTPTNPLVFTATGLDLTYQGGNSTFDLFLDAGTAVGNGVQLRASYDLTGDGTWERVETYRYFATDPIPGYEHYTQNQGLLAATGTHGNLRNGTVKLEVWSAIGNNPSTIGIGDRSLLTLPHA